MRGTMEGVVGRLTSTEMSSSTFTMQKCAGDDEKDEVESGSSF